MPTADPMSRIPTSSNRSNGTIGHKRTISAPSKLEQLQKNYQEKLLKEKEEKLMQMYQEREERNRQQIAKYEYKNTNGATFDVGRGPGSGRGGNNVGVRQFLQDRRGGQNSAGRVGGVAGKPPIPIPKNSAGRDRGNPLAPINHNSPVNSGGKVRKSEVGVLGGGGSPSGLRHSPKPPGYRKPNLVRNQRRGYATPTDSGNESSGYEDQQNRHNKNSRIPNRSKLNRRPPVNEYQASSGEEDVPNSSNSANRITSFQQWKQKQQTVRQKTHGTKATPLHNGYHSDGGGGGNDFQKWQMQQDAERGKRLEKHREANSNNNVDPDYADFRSRSPSPPMGITYSVKKNGKKPPLKRQKPRTQTYDDSPEDEQTYSSRSNNSRVSAANAATDRYSQAEAELKEKEKELLKMIEQQQAELDRMKKVREEEEEEEKRQKEEEESRSYRKAAAAAATTSRSNAGNSSHRSNRSSSASRQRTRSPSPARQAPPAQKDPFMFKKAAQVKRGPPKKKPPAPKQSNPLPPREGESFWDNSNAADFYLTALNDDPEAQASTAVNLMPCSVCGRKFAAERLAKHQNACKASAKPRKKFDQVKMRTEGTEMAQYVANAGRRPEPKKANTGDWRKKREDFIKALRYAKQVTQVEKAGGNVAALPPPPTTENAHYKQCPYCERRFAPDTAERHIPRCKDIKARPLPPKGRRGR